MEAVEVMLIEDREEDADLALRQLKKHNIANNIMWMDDSEEALEYLETNPVPPKLILLDLKMPKINGLEVLKRVREMAKTKTTPVVVMSSSKEDKDIQESYKYGVNSYIVKPVNFSEFSDTIGKLGFYWLLVNQPPK